MKISKSHSKIGLTGFLVGSLIVVTWQMASASAQGRGTKVFVPKFSEMAKAGQVAFEKTCAQCHGKNAVGTGKGPPLLHRVYNPGHHGDAAFYNAIKRGSPQHHWRFGNMPPQPGVTEDQIVQIIRYVRELQEANGIKNRPHRM